MNYKEAIGYLYNRRIFFIELGLEKITKLAEKLGNPQNDFRSVHVAGTNGKGSVCAFLDSILRKQRYRVGIYTSPHLVDFRERIRVNGKRISEKDVVRLVEKIKPLADDATYFEVVTALAFAYFKEQKVDIAIIEVGLGGRLDATNIITPLVSVITSISKEHEKHLGNTIEKIAYEKAGIIKPGVDVVVNETNRGLNKIQEICNERNSRLFLTSNLKMDSGLKGEYQYENLGIVIKTIELLGKKGYKADKENLTKGIKEVRWPGRFDFVENNVLFDCAHNVDGAKNFVENAKKLTPNKTYLIIGIMKDKNIKKMCKYFEAVGDEIILTKAKIPRAAEPEEIQKFIKKKAKIIPDIKEALEYCKSKIEKNDLIILTGSIYVVGEGFEAIGKDPFE